jgi:hypothetical protein
MAILNLGRRLSNSTAVSLEDAAVGSRDQKRDDGNQPTSESDLPIQENLGSWRVVNWSGRQKWTRDPEPDLESFK